MSKILWTPSPEQARDCAIARFMRESGHSDYPALHRWSVEDPDGFWGRLWRFCEIRASLDPSAVLLEGPRMQDAEWFPGARLNFAENLLWQEDSRIALIFRDEAGRRGEISYGRLREEVGRVAAGLRNLGVQDGDSVAAWMPNVPETIVFMLAAASTGAVFSSCSQEFGAPNSCEQELNTAPVLAAASMNTMVSGTLGIQAATESPSCTPRLRRPAATRPTSSRKRP